MKLTIGALVGLMICARLFAAQPIPARPAPSPYSLVQSIALGPGEHWDYVTFDSAQQRVYVAHGDHVSVVDTRSGTVIGQIGQFPGGTHGVAIVAAVGRGYTDDGKAGTAISFDLKSFASTKTIVGKDDADGMLFDPLSRHVFVINGDAQSITVIDPEKNEVAATISVGANLEAGVADGVGNLFVDGVAQHDIVVIDATSNRVKAHYAMPGCERPHGIAMDSKTRRVFATCINKVLVVVDADDGRNVATVAIGASSDGAVFDARRRRIISSNGEGSISVIAERSAERFESLGDFPTAPGARTIAIDPASGRLFLPTATVDKIEPAQQPGGRPHVTYVPGSMKLMVYAPTP